MTSVATCSNNYSATRQPDFTIIVPVSIYHHVSYAETYSRFSLHWYFSRQEPKTAPPVVSGHDLDGRIVIERASGGNASSQCGISTWAEDSRRRITTTPTRLKAMDSSRTSRNEPVA